MERDGENLIKIERKHMRKSIEKNIEKKLMNIKAYRDGK